MNVYRDIDFLLNCFFDKPIGYFIAEAPNVATDIGEENVDTLFLLLKNVQMYVENNIVIYGCIIQGIIQGFQKIQRIYVFYF